MPDSSAIDPLLSGLEVYEVGGAVRDRLLGIEPGDRDFVVVGSEPEVLAQRGFRPVGRDFPVFLHPHTGQEFALARTERKQGRGYHGFEFHTGSAVSLEQDLARRDLTINAMAMDAHGVLVDPYGGRRDLQARVLRHVSEAFGEDPVRILRLARFAARFVGFAIDPETLNLCRQMVAAGEVEHLVPERVWQEMSRALLTPRPSRFFEVLREVGALAIILPEVDALFGVPQPAAHHPEVDAGLHTLMVLDQAAALSGALPVRFAALVHDLGKSLTPPAMWPSHHRHEQLGLPLIRQLCERLKVPGACRELALLVGECHLSAHRVLSLRPATVVRLLERLDAFRRPERLAPFLLACEADYRGRLGLDDRPYPQADFLQAARQAAASVKAADLAASGYSGPALGEALRRRRIDRVAELIEARTP